jgi:serine/threonine protein kinase
LDGGKCEETDYLFVAMELLDPRTLGRVCKQLAAGQVAPLIAQLAGAARFLEERGIAHRDIKPDNTVVTADYTCVKLLDLGVIHPPADPTEKRAGTGDRFLGTARYSPPEFLYREEEDTVEGWRAITFYQLGATLYDLLMRRQIFR